MEFVQEIEVWEIEVRDIQICKVDIWDIEIQEIEVWEIEFGILICNHLIQGGTYCKSHDNTHHNSGYYCATRRTKILQTLP